jgi:hypothetical protein
LHRHLAGLERRRGVKSEHLLNIRTARDADALHGEGLAGDELDRRRIDVSAISKINSEVVQTDFISRHKFHFAKEGFAARKI